MGHSVHPSNWRPSCGNLNSSTCVSIAREPFVEPAESSPLLGRDSGLGSRSGFWVARVNPGWPDQYETGIGGRCWGTEPAHRQSCFRRTESAHGSRVQQPGAEESLTCACSRTICIPLIGTTRCPGRYSSGQCSGQPRSQCRPRSPCDVLFDKVCFIILRCVLRMARLLSHSNVVTLLLNELLPIPFARHLFTDCHKSRRIYICTLVSYQYRVAVLQCDRR